MTILLSEWRAVSRPARHETAKMAISGAAPAPCSGRHAGSADLAFCLMLSQLQQQHHREIFSQQASSLSIWS
jgi:hypothetical protein